MSVTDSLTTRDRQLADWISGNTQFEKPYLLVAALRKADIKPQTALALESKEGGRNVFGHDWQRELGLARANEDRPPYNGHRVTETRCRRLFDSEFSNGVGPPQLTSKGLVAIARKRGGEWGPYFSRWTGYEHLKGLINRNGYEAGANRYNGGDSDQGERNGAAADYGSEFVQHRREWERKLVAAGFKVA